MKLLLTLIVCSHGLLSQTWLRINDFPGTGRDDGVGVVVNNKAYFGSGLGGGLPKDFYALDLVSGGWSPIAKLPDGYERQYACAFSGPGCFYLFGGEMGGALNTTIRYDVAADGWTTVSPKPGNGLMGATSMAFGDKIIIAGGKVKDGGPVNDEVWEYTLSTDTWAKKNNFPFGGTWRASAAVLNNSGYLIFGRDANDAFRKELYKYDPVADTWSKVTDFPGVKGRAYAAMQGIQNKLVLFGGYDSLNSYYNDTWFYTESANSWAHVTDLPSSGRKGGMSCAANGKLYYSCGIDLSDRLRETWVLDVPLSASTDAPEKEPMGWPNPVENILHVTLREKERAFLTDLYGREVAARAGDPDLPAEMDLRGLRSGMYLLRIYSPGGQVRTMRIIKN